MAGLVKKSDTWKYLKAKDKRVDKSVYAALDRKISEVLDKAAEKAGTKKTITDEDILAVTIG